MQLDESEEVLLIFCKKYRKIGTIASLTYLFKGLGFEHFEDTTPKGFPVKEISESNNQNASVYVFKRSGTNWSQIAYIKAANSRADINFGKVVTLDNSTIIVGSPWENSNQHGIRNGTSASTNTSGGSQSGAAWVYRFYKNGDITAPTLS